MKRHDFVKLSVIAAVMMSSAAQLKAQTNYTFGTSSGVGGAAGAGYTTADQKVTFTNAATSTLSTTNVTLTLSDQQYGNGTSHKFQGMTAAYYSGAVAFGAAGQAVYDFTPASFQRYGNLGFYGGATSAHFTASKETTAGTGISSATTKALNIGILTDALIDSLGNNINYLSDLGTDIYFADLTLTFNEKVSNPVIHLGGLGGAVWVPQGSNLSFLGYSAVLELQDDFPVTRLSGSPYFDIDGTTRKVTSTSLWKGAPSNGTCQGGEVQRYGGSGSILVNAINIDTLKFRIYLRSDAGKITSSFDTSASTSPIPCDSPAITYPFTATSYPRLAGINQVTADGIMLSVSFARMKITGNVFNDPDGGFVNNSTGAVNSVPAGMYANLVDSVTGFVVKSVPVGTDGVYDFGDQNANRYQVILSSSTGTPGAAAPSLSLPAGWIATGAFNGTPNTGNTGNTNGISEYFKVTEAANTANINFGIQQLPETDDLASTVPQPGTNDTLILDGLGANPSLLSGNDAQDGVYEGASGFARNPSGVIITSLPDNGELFYDGNPVAVGDTIIDPSLLTIVVSGEDYTEVNFEYAYIDAAGYADPTPATYNVNWAITLPVKLLYFNAYSTNNKEAVLEWGSASEENNKGFGVERSGNGKKWYNIGFVTSLAPDGNSGDKLSYTFNDHKPVAGINYYRLKQTDFDNDCVYSTVQTVTFGDAASINIYPNPANDRLTIDGLRGNETISLTGVTGQHMLFINTLSNSIILNINGITSGIYMLTVTDASGSVITSRKIQKIH